MKPLADDIVRKVLFMLNEGKSVREIGTCCNIHHSSVVRIRKNCRQNLIASKGGRPRKLSDRDSRNMARLLTAGTAKTPKEAAITLGKNISEWTARRSLNRIGLQAAEKKKKPALSAKNILARKQFLERHRHWTVKDWEQVN